MKTRFIPTSDENSGTTLPKKDTPSGTPVDGEKFDSLEIEFSDRLNTVESEFHADGLVDAKPTEICNSLSSARDLMGPASVVCLVLLTLMAICYSLYFCKPVMLPIVGAFLLNFLFSPVVAKLNRFGVPNALAALLILTASLGLVCLLILFAYDPAKDWLSDRDANIVVVERKLMSLRKPFEQLRDVSEKIDKITAAQPKSDVADPPSEENPPKVSAKDEQSLDQNQKADPAGSAASKSSNDLLASSPNEKLASSPNDKLAPSLKNNPNTTAPTVESESGANGVVTKSDDLNGDAGEKSAKSRAEEPPKKDVVVAAPVPVEVRQPSISSRIFSTTGDVLIGFSLMIVLLYYLLASGDRGLEKLIALMPNWRQKRRTVELSRAIEKSVSSYLLTTTLINAGLGVVIGTGLWLTGMPNPILWGVMAMVLNYFPFVGAIIGAAIVFVVAVVSFDSIAFAAVAPAIYLIANLIEANFITPVLLGRSVSLHPVWLMIFFVVVSWVWGLGGAIVAVPVLAVIKITCDHIEPLIPLGTFLGR